MTIQTASIKFNEQGTPIATEFDDVYFSNDNGLAETQYVFIDGNQLASQWQNTNATYFCIGETGFGTGLNFLLSAKRFLEFQAQNPSSTLERLFFLSTEKYPLNPDDLELALRLWPELNTEATELLNAYPSLLPGFHRLSLFNGSVILDLFLGDATEGFSAAHSYEQGRVDAWFLDGFAPSKNNSMWQPALFNAIARLSRPNASFATFTAAGAVKRGLQEYGFDVRKQKGFGRKREMLVGHFIANSTDTKQAPIFYRHTLLDTNKAGQHIGVVGAGIAGAITALKLIQRGHKVTLYCADDAIAKGASGNDQGGFYPQLNAEAGNASLVHAHSFLYARRFYDDLLNSGHHFAHQWCGVLQLAFNDNVTSRYQNMIRNNTWPTSLVHKLNAKEASEVAGVEIPYQSLFLPLGGWISPPELVHSCVNACITAAAKDTFSVKTDFRLDSYDTDPQTLQLHFSNGRSECVDALVLACGAQSPQFEHLSLPFRLTRGQVESIPSKNEFSNLATVLCHKGYMTPAMKGFHAMGSTYVKNELNTQYRVSEAEINLAMHQKAMHAAKWSDALTLNQQTSPGRAALRCSLPDHLPAVGALPNFDLQQDELNELYKAKPDSYYPIPSVKKNVFMLTALGSRGLTTAPLAAEVLVNQMMGEPLPMDNTLLNVLNPNRFLIRDLIRRR
ncbi:MULTISPECIES: bifunctional tRNA (5-methylaminomethyl-2-thiouridine)(34)-methyltransferase MnmD/FAD-dependent 5-carboxymethylaminomethyl-2-thiouridine(34) oxidoreductase MnmC [Alteromonadaceae]|uniref:tRNA 5-methylaminomethyl-2-thiouridine biosynthesis bifunctional protein MnmC n=1 Tax=Brumicola blandensis TaxID=3075611 RepID=A0AAW8R0W6_9ALTE|nr:MULTISPECIES: bifunctional tRNA (5-methylaminomethyl-2-thiouridine)(34)-methyltransferase MnmD/FAD-dependent 5-carboxymethylaminomethyl-2-thiouridine(34) oxidoreductase MnmC [unclassified Alteromonas]MDT0581902.1 bifunctional tRNA (5-methylaminomethyl-2-thiouridine)(34)-methyltransferase MnmD/FAD-dependent 5-carboxymethylaminomethyl-2-thiouridine(34) oxidoreductase MnmC [Alteromonas sp. W409]MDT0628420.1 bifunctional tRNA (5-methylaminomethyl-2-thiouridine)(34)-methyltransferase MnmD/FAD-depen